MRLLAASILDELALRAAASPRRRAHLNVHASAADPVQRFFVAACRDTYIRPHRHHSRSELALVLRGRFDVLTFDDAGALIARHVIGERTDSMGYELPPATWHMVIAADDGAAFLEVKEGPYDPATAAEFASWAPLEGTPAACAFLERARSADIGAALAAL
jgi:cupin fold WbuC family metalloprotein